VVEHSVKSVAVVGVGTIGAMTLWQLARRGIHAVGYDSYAPGHDRGGAGGESRIFRTAYQEGTQYVPLLEEALDLWRKLEVASGQRLFYQNGCATVGPADHPKISAVQNAAAAHDLPLEVLKSDEARRRVPEHPLRDGEVLLLDRQGGLLKPEPSVVAAVSLAESAGAEVRRYSPVLDVQDNRGSAMVWTGGGQEEYDRVIVCPGPWARRLPILRGYPLTPKLLTATWFPRRSSSAFTLDSTPVAIRVGQPAYSCFPSVDGTGVKVIVHGHFTDLTDPEALPRSAEVDVVRRASRAVAETLPGVVPDPIRVGTYSDIYTADEHALLGPASPDSGAVILAAGFSGHGFKLAPAFGRLAADLALTGSTDQDVSFLSPARFTTTTRTEEKPWPLHAR